MLRWCIIPFVVCCLFHGCGGATRFVRTSSGQVEARQPLQVSPPPSSSGQGEFSAEELADFAFLNLPGSQPKATNRGKAVPGSDRWRSVLTSIGLARRKQMDQKAPSEGAHIVEQESGISKSIEGADTEEDVSTVELAYLYDDVFFPNGAKMAEKDLHASVKHRSATGMDDPEWEHLETPWDHFRGISLRAQHGLFRTEKEMEALFREEGGTINARKEAQNKILSMGRSNPEMWTVWNHLGNTFRATGEIHRAIQCFRRALYINPDNADVLLNLSVVLQTLGFLDEAEVMIRYSIERLGSAVGVLQPFILGNILFEQGSVQAAIEQYRKALKVQPSFLPVMKRLRDLGVDVNSLHHQVESPGTASLSLFEFFTGSAREEEEDTSLENSLAMFSHLVGLVMFLIGAITLLGCSDELEFYEDEEDEYGEKAKKKGGNRKKARRKERSK